MELYRKNLLVSQAFYPILNLFEVFLRNALYNSIGTYFSDPDWIINQKNGFMSDPSLQRSNFFLKRCVEVSEKTIMRKGADISSGKIIAEQSLSFWTSFFEPYNYRLIKGVPIKTFRYKPSSENRKSIADKLNRIRILRNRIYHNEPICFWQGKPDFSNALQVQTEIYLLLSWIEPELKDYTKVFDSIDLKL